MPWLDDKGRTSTQAVIAPQSADPDFLDALGAAWRTENTVGSALNRDAGFNPAPDLDDPFDPIAERPEDIPEEYAKSYAFAENMEDTQRITRQIRREMEDRQTLAQSGVSGFMAGLMMGIADPINLVPVGGTAVRAYRTGGSILRAAGSTARAGATGAVIAETALHATQETRTVEESAFNVAGATFLSGVIGAAAGKIAGRGSVNARAQELGGRVEQDLTVPAPGEPDPMTPNSVHVPELDEVEISTSNPEGGSLSAAAVDNFTTKAQEGLASALGVEKAVAFQDPIMRGLTSAAVTTRRAIQRIAEVPVMVAKNKEGIASDIAVETRVKMWDAPLAKGLTVLDDAFVSYREQISGKRQGRARIAIGDVFSRTDAMSFDDFKIEVGRAMRRGDEHSNPHVAQAAKALRKEVFDPLKDAAVELKMLPEGVDVTTAPSYLTRLYNKQALTTRKTDFIQITANWLRTRDADSLDEELQDIAEQIWSRIVGTPDGRMPYDVDLSEIRPRGGKSRPNVKGPLKTRSFDIPDELIEDFLESDIEMISRMYVRSMAPDVELARAFNGDVSMTEAIKEVDAEWRRIINAAPEKDRAKLNAKREADIRDISGVRDRIRHTYAMPSNPDGLVHRALQVTRSLNFQRLLGGMTLTSFPDAARPVMVHGLSRVFGDGIRPLVTNLQGMKLAAREVKLAGTALDMVLDSRTMSIADVMDDFGRRTKFERGLQALQSRFGTVSLMAPWNAAMKQFSGIVTMSRMLDATAAVADGSISQKEIAKLAHQGIDAGMAKRIARQFAEHGAEDRGVKMANTEAWTDAGAVKAFRAGLVKEVDKIIVTPGQDKPLWMSTDLGRTIGQFKSFSVASTQRTLISGLQQRDMAALSGSMMMVGLGMLTYAVKEYQADRELSDDPEKWIAEGFDRSGLTGWFFEANNIMEKVTRGKVGISALTGGPQMSRYASRNVTGALLGPTFGLTQDFVQTTGAAFAGDWQEQDTRALRRLIPYQNLLYLRDVLDKAEDGINDAFGVN